MQEKLIELRKKPNINKYEVFLSELKSDAFTYVEALTDLIKLLTEKKDYDQIIKLLEDSLMNPLIQESNLRIKLLDRLINTLLKIENFYKLEKALEERQKYIKKDNEIIMQKFYLGVCYEGLEKPIKAIEVLESIPDNISSQNLANKYLKLAMLYLKVNNIEIAKKHYYQAGIFDRLKKNPVFLLYQSDLAYKENDFLKALNFYQDYFIKSLNKYRYLDRYMMINIELGRLVDAYDFYKKHLAIMQKVLSKSSRLLFYKTALIVCEKLNNLEEMSFLENAISEIESTLKPINNPLSIAFSLLDNLYDKTFIKEREIIHAILQQIDQFKLFSKTLVVNIEGGVIDLLHYSKGLLLEKRLNEPYLTNNIFHDILLGVNNSIYDSDMLLAKNNDIYLSDNTEYVFVEELKTDNFLVFYLEDKLAYYNAKTSFDFIALITKKLLNDYRKYGLLNNLEKNTKVMFDQLNYGFVLIKDNNLYLLNQVAKNIFDTDKPYLNYEDFQGNLKKTIYIDEFLVNEELTVEYQAKTLKQINFKIFVDGFDIYLLVSLVLNPQVSSKNNSIETLLNLELIQDNTILMINIRNYHELFKNYKIENYYDYQQNLIKQVRLHARNYFNDYYQEGLDNLYFIIASKDRRIITRIIDSVVSNNMDLRFSYLSIKDTSISDAIDYLKYLNSLTDKENRVLTDNKIYRYNQEVAKTILLNSSNILKKGEIKLSFQPIVNWQTNIYRYIYVDALEKVLLGDSSSLRRVLNANYLEAEWDLLMVSQLVKECKNYNFKGEFFLKIGVNTLNDQQYTTKIQNKIISKGFNKSKIIYVVDYQDYQEYNNSTFENIAFMNTLKEFRLQDIEVLKKCKYLIFEPEEITSEAFDYFLNIINDFGIEIIYNHKKSSLSKSFLLKNKLLHIFGEAFGKFDKLSEIRKTEE